ncbi:MAG: hypothetical protein Q8T09_23160 [Candidatus Melainabacteria bacterium]|nr:hypothetical protein [Candidatus Melainabacteria bacterium]
MTIESAKNYFYRLNGFPKLRLFAAGACAATLLVLSTSQLTLAVDDDYGAARSQFLDELNYAQSRGIGVTNYKRLLESIDEQAQTDGDRQTKSNKISSLHMKLKEQVTAVDREGFDSLGSEIQSKVWKQLTGVERYWGLCLEFEVTKDSKFSHFKWITHSRDPKTDQEVLDAFSRVSLNKRSTNQAELPLTARFSPSLYSYLSVLNPATGKEKYHVLRKFPCFKPLPY